MINRRSFLGAFLKLLFFFTIIMTPLKTFKILQYKNKFNKNFEKFISKYILSLKNNYNIVEFGSYYIILNNYKPVIAINETAYFIWKNLKKTRVNSIINKIINNYDVSYAQAKKDVLNTIFIFYKLSFIELNI